MTATARNTFNLPIDFEPTLSAELEAKINGVLFNNPSCKTSPSTAARDVLFIVRGHAGAGRAITIGQISASQEERDPRIWRRW